MSMPVTGSTIRAYCDCANKKRDESSPVIAGAIETTWICKSEYKDTVKSGVFSSIGRYRYYWECLNCGKKRLIGIWDNEGNCWGT